VIADLSQAKRLRVADQHAEDAAPAWGVSDGLVRRFVDSRRQEPLELLPGRVDHPERRVTRAGELGGRRDDLLEHAVERELGAHRDPSLDHGSQPPLDERPWFHTPDYPDLPCGECGPLWKTRTRSAAGSGGMPARSPLPSTKDSKRRREMSSAAPVAGQHRMQHKQSNSPGLWAVVSVLLGILVALLGFFALLMWVAAHQANDAATRAADKAANADSSMANMPGMSTPAPAAASTGLGELTSYAGAAPANADALAAAHKPFPAALPAAPAGPIANVNL